ncbi:fibulin-2-like isoform X2 [Nymphalis io]|uniref:fibulin-2-like isoform X2 n=1 Tax=Inachis io TaxID=171585 RepID=UPI002167F679|nr:fibulin-2-like isoform X2 [Nymphalis io]
MKFLIVMKLVLFFSSNNFVLGLTSEEITEVTETCCTHGETFALTSSSKDCSGVGLPDDLDPEHKEICLSSVTSCCEQQFQLNDECAAGIKLAALKQCMVPKSDIGKTCCEECKIGRLTGESQGKMGCGELSDDFFSPASALRKKAYYQCCMDASEELETTTEKKETTTTEKPKEKYINECAEAIDDLCTAKDTVCHNTEGSFKCVPLKKRDVSLSCPPGFKRNVINQVCDDINECRLPKPPCPKYLCENTIGGYKCAGKPGKPFSEDATKPTPESGAATTSRAKVDICPIGFRAGPDDECLDIDECEETLDDCQRLSQHCINSHGSYFCQDHVSKRCAPGFKVNSVTGICEDIDECEESLEVCKRNEVCINLPGAYNCKSKISTLPKLATKTCQEGTRVRPGGTICEDIDECREGSHLCDQFQNCINTFGGHECRCKNGFELDSTSGSCVDVDECAMKLDNCAAGHHCLNVLGSFTCTRRPITTSTTTALPAYEYEYYDFEEETTETSTSTTSSTTTPRPTTTSTTTLRPTTTSTTTTTTLRPTTTSTTSTTTPRPTTTSTTTTLRPNPPPRRYPHYPRPSFRRTTTPVPPYRRPDYYPRRPVIPLSPTEITVNKSRDPVTIEKEKQPDGSYSVNTSDIPKETWTVVTGKESTDDFDPNRLHCLNGYERNERGECVDINECRSNRNICGVSEVCINSPGGYKCECKLGYSIDDFGKCVFITPPTTRKPTTTTERTTPRVDSTASTPARTPDWLPWAPGRNNPTQNCELGHIYSSTQKKCIDIDECATGRASCAPEEDCINTDGGYSCVCGLRCRANSATPTYTYRETPPPYTPDSTIITVGAQYGQRGTHYMRPTYTRLQETGSVVTTCPWGYKLTPDRVCVDIDECERNVSECGPQQRCENFYGGYSCQCPPGHRNIGKDCEDIDECSYGNICSYNARCVNTIGSYRCECSDGFRNAPTNDKVCVDVDECVDTPSLCEHSCANAWGGYRCYCNRGYRLNNDNRTCVDIDECEEWGRARSRGRLCGGRCVNAPGSYRCDCPQGYRLGEDKRTCIDIDECESGEARCGQGDGEVCQNTRGGYHCHHIDCPPGYQLEGKHKCTRIQRSCPISDWGCLHQPSTYSYNFITFVSKLFLPMGRVDLFSMQGPGWLDSVVNFEMRLLNVKAAPGVEPADISCFGMRPTANVCVVSLQCSLAGPQVAELELTMSLYQRAQYAGSAVARLIVIVSEYEY